MLAAALLVVHSQNLAFRNNMARPRNVEFWKIMKFGDCLAKTVDFANYLLQNHRMCCLWWQAVMDGLLHCRQPLLSWDFLAFFLLSGVLPQVFYFYWGGNLDFCCWWTTIAIIYWICKEKECNYSCSIILKCQNCSVTRTSYPLDCGFGERGEWGEKKILDMEHHFEVSERVGVTGYHSHMSNWFSYGHYEVSEREEEE